MQRREELLQVYSDGIIGSYINVVIQKTQTTRKYKDLLDILLSVKV